MTEKIKTEAVKLRKKGLSYNEITKKLGTPKSTLSYWLKTIPVPKKHKERLYNARVKNITLGQQSQKERRKREVEKIIEEAKKEIEFPISNDTFKLFGAALYWAEGSKKGPIRITNSDPHFILLIVKWFENIFKIKPNQLKAQLNIYEQQNDKIIKSFWSDLTKIPIEQFGKSYIKPSNKGYKKNNLYYGTIQIIVPKSTDLKYKIFGWIESTLQEINPNVELTKERWQKLESVKRPPANL